MISSGAASRMTANARLTTFPPNGILFFLLNCALLFFHSACCETIVAENIDEGPPPCKPSHHHVIRQNENVHYLTVKRETKKYKIK